MAELKWRDSYKIGVNFIDEDHKNLLNILTGINKEIDTGNCSRCAELLNNFITEKNYIFPMKKYSYMGLITPTYDNIKPTIKNYFIESKKTRKILGTLETKEAIRKCFDGMARFF